MRTGSLPDERPKSIQPGVSGLALVRRFSFNPFARRIHSGDSMYHDSQAEVEPGR